MGAADYNSSDPREFDDKEAKDISSQFDNTILLVRDYSSRLEKDYVRPALGISRTFFAERPIVATFCAIFLILSFFPIISFLGVSVFVITSLTTIALGGALLTASAIILALSLILASILIAIFFTAVLLTIFTISSYFFFRLSTLVRQDGRSGISNWARETKQHFTWGPHSIRLSVPIETPVEPITNSQLVDQPEPKDHSPVLNTNSSDSDNYEKVQG